MNNKAPAESDDLNLDPNPDNINLQCSIEILVKSINIKLFKDNLPNNVFVALNVIGFENRIFTMKDKFDFKIDLKNIHLSNSTPVLVDSNHFNVLNSNGNANQGNQGNLDSLSKNGSTYYDQDNFYVSDNSQFNNNFNYDNLNRYNNENKLVINNIGNTNNNYNNNFKLNESKPTKVDLKINKLNVVLNELTNNISGNNRKYDQGLNRDVSVSSINSSAKTMGLANFLLAEDHSNNGILRDKLNEQKINDHKSKNLSKLINDFNKSQIKTNNNLIINNNNDRNSFTNSKNNNNNKLVIGNSNNAKKNNNNNINSKDKKVMLESNNQIKDEKTELKFININSYTNNSNKSNHCFSFKLSKFIKDGINNSNNSEYVDSLMANIGHIFINLYEEYAKSLFSVVGDYIKPIDHWISLARKNFEIKIQNLKEIYLIRKYILNKTISSKDKDIKLFRDYLLEDMENARKFNPDEPNFEINYFFNQFYGSFEKNTIETNLNVENLSFLSFNSKSKTNNKEILNNGKCKSGKINFNSILNKEKIFVKIFDFEFEYNDPTTVRITLLNILSNYLNNIKSSAYLLQPGIRSIIDEKIKIEQIKQKKQEMDKKALNKINSASANNFNSAFNNNNNNNNTGSKDKNYSKTHNKLNGTNNGSNYNNENDFNNKSKKILNNIILNNKKTSENIDDSIENNEVFEQMDKNKVSTSNSNKLSGKLNENKGILNKNFKDAYNLNGDKLSDSDNNYKDFDELSDLEEVFDKDSDIFNEVGLVNNVQAFKQQETTKTVDSKIHILKGLQ